MIKKDITINDVEGFKSIGIDAKLRKEKRENLALIYAKNGAIASGVFTQNVIKAAPVIYNMKNIENENIKAVIINSGNANACTGEVGYQNTEIIAKNIAKHLEIESEEVLVNSTGIIGVQLPMDKILSGIEKICTEVQNHNDKHSIARAIMTTDTKPKEIGVELELDGKKVKIAGIAKGSGMIHPNMATMLGFIVTDINITKDMLEKAFKPTIDKSFNMISVDGDTSTNDTCIILSSRKAKNKLIDKEDKNFNKFKEALEYVNIELAKMIAADGEGATKLLEVNVVNYKNEEEAKILAKSIITSNLTKAAFFGADANWGRILCAMGYSGVQFTPNTLDLYFKSGKGEIKVFENGLPIIFNEDKVKEILLEKEVIVIADFKTGEHSATAWGCDLTYDYVKINGSYRS
ncbi:glutamate N-acetyltransferase [Hypnocyclicus thermotrophus]|uniref:Arginine biosynthesis bifunctional protein ArgJ n=1 Tax=Hypnocyclicus thermotrophus TaxID=1627895 RepID=A0AA46DYW9_9FUSO|nr:bifunctional glutamate N-acetyltransferase/amino-acid acetyltransferase ArgJ [Hypnocyclicus thermotrophus]TDT70632.1 glutamate N-acetyltransferase [Hypnocyclicus thermotrophus]